ncbi:MAG: VWA domain-containing protein, partial [Acidobacteria bacterium]|nr:VWA domain-containing protein [Acidobacteriota bacterium]
NISTATPQSSGTPSAKPSPTPDDEIIKVETNLITTPVSVLDRNGRFIAGLKKKDFQVFDNGIQQEIQYFQSEDSPFTVFLLLDVSPSTKYKIDDIHLAARTFVDQLRPTDKVMVIAFDQRIRLLTPDPTSDKQALYAAIDRAIVGSGTSIYEAVRYVTEMDLVKQTGRKAIVIFSDGVDTTSRRQYATFDSTVQGVTEVDALVYPIHYNTAADVGGGLPGLLGFPGMSSPGGGGSTPYVFNTASGTLMPMPGDIAQVLASRGLGVGQAFNTNAGGGSSTAPAIINKATGAVVPMPPDIKKELQSRGMILAQAPPQQPITRIQNLGAGTSQAEAARGLSYLTQLSQNSGGRIFEAADIKDMGSAFSNVADELRKQYSIGYYPPEGDKQPGEHRTLKVKVTRPGAVVRSKTGYVIKSPIQTTE